VQEDPPSALQESLAYGRANPTRAAGDQRGLAFKPLHDALLPDGRQRDQRAGARPDGRIRENTRQYAQINESKRK
jgi:hypothetical protein